MTLVPDDTVRFYLSGGPGNSDPDRSLGGGRGAEISPADMAAVFDRIGARQPGHVDYRCIYVSNHAAPDMERVKVYRAAQQGTFFARLAGAVSPDAPLTLPDEETAPVGLALSDLQSSGGVSAVNSMAALHGDYFLRVLPDSTTIHRLDQSTRQITLGSVQEPDLGSDAAAAVYTGSRLIWLTAGANPSASDAPWDEAAFTLGATRTLSSLGDVETVNALAFDRQRSKLLVAGHLEHLYTYDYDPVAGTLADRRRYTTSENIYAMALIQGTNILVYIFRTEAGIVTMKYSAWNPADGSLDEARALDVALPDTAVNEDVQTAMTVVGQYLCYNIDIAGNDFRSYRVTTPQPAFGNHAGRANALPLGSMAAGDQHALWIRREARPVLEAREDAGFSLVVEGDA